MDVCIRDRMIFAKQLSVFGVVFEPELSWSWIQLVAQFTSQLGCISFEFAINA